MRNDLSPRLLAIFLNFSALDSALDSHLDGNIGNIILYILGILSIKKFFIGKLSILF